MGIEVLPLIPITGALPLEPSAASSPSSPSPPHAEKPVTANTHINAIRISNNLLRRSRADQARTDITGSVGRPRTSADFPRPGERVCEEVRAASSFQSAG